MMPSVRPLAALAAPFVVSLSLLFGCGNSEPDAATESAPASLGRTESAPDPAPAPSPAAAPAKTPQRQERPLPAFDGTTLDGEPFSVSDLLGRRALLFFFDPNAREAGAAAEASHWAQGRSAPGPSPAITSSTSASSMIRPLRSPAGSACALPRR
jgi:hypothetical protein